MKKTSCETHNCEFFFIKSEDSALKYIELSYKSIKILAFFVRAVLREQVISSIETRFSLRKLFLKSLKIVVKHVVFDTEFEVLLCCFIAFALLYCKRQKVFEIVCEKSTKLSKMSLHSDLQHVEDELDEIIVRRIRRKISQ